MYILLFIKEKKLGLSKEHKRKDRVTETCESREKDETETRDR